MDPSLELAEPIRDDDTAPLVGGVLLGVFIYWGWDSGRLRQRGVQGLGERTGQGGGDEHRCCSSVIYVVVAYAAQAYAGTDFLRHNKDDVLSALGSDVFGSPLDKLLIIAVLTSAAASTQTTILPTARTTLDDGALRCRAKALGEINPRYLTPGTSTLLMGGISLVWTLIIINVDHQRARRLAHRTRLSDRLLLRAHRVRVRDLLPPRALQEREELLHGRAWRRSWAALMLTFIFVKAFIDNAPADSAYSGGLFGVGAADRDRGRPRARAEARADRAPAEPRTRSR